MSRRRSWPYHSHAELTAAGYRYDHTSRCRGARCGEIVFWYRTPRGAAMPIDQVTFAPHHATCASAAVFKRLARMPKPQRERVECSLSLPF